MRVVGAAFTATCRATTFWSFGSSFPGPTFQARRGLRAVDRLDQPAAADTLPADPSTRFTVPRRTSLRSAQWFTCTARASRRGDGNPEPLVRHCGRVGELLLSQRPGRGHAHGSLRSHDGHQPPQRVRRADGRVTLIRDAAEGRGSTFRAIAPTFHSSSAIACCSAQTDRLDYPVSGNPDSPWVDDATGDAVILINGKLFPSLDVEPRRNARFRLINGSERPLSTRLAASTTVRRCIRLPPTRD